MPACCAPRGSMAVSPAVLLSVSSVAAEFLLCLFVVVVVVVVLAIVVVSVCWSLWRGRERVLTGRGVRQRVCVPREASCTWQAPIIRLRTLQYAQHAPSTTKARPVSSRRRERAAAGGSRADRHSCDRKRSAVEHSSSTASLTPLLGMDRVL